jgi:hypothetical protein
MVKVSKINYEVGDRVRRLVPWGRLREYEYGTVVRIPDGEDIDFVEVLTEDDGAHGDYDPTDWSKV